MALSVCLVLIIIVARLIFVQGVDSSQYTSMAQSEVDATVPINRLRGAIYSSSGSVLAMSVIRQDVIADPFQISDPTAEALKLAPVLGVSEADLAALMSEHSGYAVLARQVTTAEANRIAAMNLAGITFQPVQARIYPAGSLGQSFLGRVGYDGQGVSGLEYQYNGLLSGKSGTEVLAEAPGGIQMPGPAKIDHRASGGYGLELTIDEPLQYLAEKALESEVVASHAQSGSAILMNVRTGAILAMANVVAGPAGSAVPAQENLAATAVYEPGSVFKIVTFGTSLQDGVITPNTTFIVPDQKIYDGWLYHDAWTHPPQPMTATQIIAQSSNIGTIHIAHLLGSQRLAAAVTNFGFGLPTGLHYPGASPGLIRPLSQWSPTTIDSLPIGQVDAVTALQILDAMNAVANGGVLVHPRLVQAEVLPDGELRPVKPLPSRRIISATAASELRGMLEQVVNYGTGTKAVIPGYTVAGKTGTANIASTTGPGYAPGAYSATFAGFAPEQDPAFSAIVVLMHPVPIYGGSVSAPVFAKLMAYALAQFHVPPIAPASGRSVGQNG
ncbi:MAG: penicillin-binding protein 2 [Actinobacteria bacterium]|nr:penicillin-binding protein 2 [Actinomycetota bacterium]